jgi:FtsP/CotA-like multicopper oxidase with cupredoxin domain
LKIPEPLKQIIVLNNANVPVKLPGIIEKFVDELPIPQAINPVSQGNDSAYFEVEMKCGSHKFHRDFNETIIYGYNGIYPGPTIETMRGQTVNVKWINHLPIASYWYTTRLKDDFKNKDCSGMITLIFIYLDF